MPAKRKKNCVDLTPDLLLKRKIPLSQAAEMTSLSEDTLERVFADHSSEAFSAPFGDGTRLRSVDRIKDCLINSAGPRRGPGVCVIPAGHAARRTGSTAANKSARCLTFEVRPRERSSQKVRN